LKTALITGASGGIGLEMSKLFARDNHNLVLVARNSQKLEELAGELHIKYNISCKVISKDLSNPSAPEEIFKELSQKGIQIDYLVNNAGFGGTGYFSDTKLEYELSMIQVNINALVELTKLFLPQMILRKSGRILNVASTAAFAPGPLMAIYYATKAFVLSFSEALTSELKDKGISVTALCPGPTKTGFQEQASVGGTRLIKYQVLHEPKYVAEKGYKAMMKGKAVVVPGFQNKLLIQSIRFTPRIIVRAITRWLQEGRK
jgi:short-subunit dehydrogenase